MAVEVLTEFMIIQPEYGAKIMNFLKTELENISIIEHFQNFYRFKRDTKISIDNVFGVVEDMVIIRFKIFKK